MPFHVGRATKGITALIEKAAFGCVGIHESLRSTKSAKPFCKLISPDVEGRSLPSYKKRKGLEVSRIKP